MTRQELIKRLALRTPLTEVDATGVLNNLVAIITTEVAKGEKVSIAGFGTFHRAHRAARHGVDPQTGADIQVPAMDVPGFRAGSQFKASLRGVKVGAR